MPERFPEMLTGGHRNSLGRTERILDEVAADPRLGRWPRPELEGLSRDARKAVAKRATKRLAELGS